MRKIQYFQMVLKGIERKEDGTVQVEGYASTSDTDRYNDRVLPTAFTESMPVFMQNPVMLLQHDSNKLIGSFDSYEIDARGLKVRGTVKYDIDDCLRKVAEGALGAFSIGFIVQKYEIRDKNGNLVATEEGIMPGFDVHDKWADGNVRVITKLDLVEISIVTTPANPYALFQSAKGFFAEERKSAMDLMAIEAGCETKAAAETKPETEPEGEDDGDGCETEEDGCGKKPQRKEGEAETQAEAVTEAQQAQESTEGTNEAPTTEKEAPAGEGPATPETVDVPAEVTSEPVEAGEQPQDVQAVVEEAVEKATGKLAERIGQLERQLAESEAKQARLETDILKISVAKGYGTAETARKNAVTLSDAVVMKSLGL